MQRPGVTVRDPGEAGWGNTARAAGEPRGTDPHLLSSSSVSSHAPVHVVSIHHRQLAPLPGGLTAYASVNDGKRKQCNKQSVLYRKPQINTACIQ